MQMMQHCIISLFISVLALLHSNMDVVSLCAECRYHGMHTQAEVTLAVSLPPGTTLFT